MTEKKPPNLPAKIEADLTRDLRAVGGFFSGLFRFTQKAERVVKEAAREDCCSKAPAGWRCSREAGHEGPCAAWPVQESRPIARTSQGVEVLPKCEVCGDKREVGEGKKIPCPACAKR